MSVDVCSTSLRDVWKPAGHEHRESTEQIELELIPFAHAVERAFAGEIHDAPSTLALILADRKLRSG
jgi:hypothetical protein